MMQGRFISYIYRYGRNDSKEQNVGFIKVQRISRGNDRCRIHINVRDTVRNNQVKCKAYLFGRQEQGIPFRDLLSECMICRGMGELNLDTAWAHVTADGRAMDDYNGIILSCEDGGLYASSWAEDEIRPGEILAQSENPDVWNKVRTQKERTDIQDESRLQKDASEKNKHMQMTWGQVETVEARETNKIEKEAFGKTDESEADVFSQNETIADEEHVSKAGENQEISETVSYEAEAKRTGPEQNIPAQDEKRDAETSDVAAGAEAETYESTAQPDFCRTLLDNRQKLDTIEDSRFLECVKIEPQDIGRLAMSNWQLGTNSFLSHGHFNYKHLMLGRIQFGKRDERYVIGVPGVYSNKEKYLANMFGFHVFIPARAARVLTGCFGYWITEVKN